VSGAEPNSRRQCEEGPRPATADRCHRQRAYEARRLQQAATKSVGEPETGITLTPTTSPAEPVTVTGGISPDLRWALGTAVGASGLVDAMVQAQQTSVGRPALLRQSVETLAAVMTDTLAAAGLPMLTADDEPAWATVAPVSTALRQAAETVEDHGRSAPRLDRARHALLAAAATMVDPDVHPERWGSPRHLPVVIPGPCGQLPAGIVDCDLEFGCAPCAGTPPTPPPDKSSCSPRSPPDPTGTGTGGATSGSGTTSPPTW